MTAYDGLTAVKRFREEQPDLVLLDLAMPGLDGYSVIGQMRAQANVPVVVVSGRGPRRPRSGRSASVRTTTS